MMLKDLLSTYNIDLYEYIKLVIKCTIWRKWNEKMLYGIF